MTHMRFSAFGTLALLLAAALPLMAQAGDARQFDPNKPGWAHPPIIVLPSPDVANVAAGYKPSQIRTGYGLTSITNKGGGQTIAIVDAFDNPNAESDLGVFTTQFSLPSCTTANGCFKKIYATGTKPPTNTGWAGEISLDIEWSHAVAPRAKIILVEAATNSNAALLHGVDIAVQNGASVVSMSWSGGEYSAEVSDDSHFNVTGVTFCASSGDGGHGVGYPAASPFVVAVGGTTLHLTTAGVWQSETAWNGSGGGASKYETEPSYQATAQNTGKRGVPDVAWDANPNTGVPVYSKTGFGGWAEVGGTSLSSPSWAGLFAIVNSSRKAAGKSLLTQPQFLLYPDAETDYHDITSGTNGSCGAQCTAGPGYDFVTGIGSPQANLLVPALVAHP
jgi:subtilase family serine protease